MAIVVLEGLGRQLDPSHDLFSIALELMPALDILIGFKPRQTDKRAQALGCKSLLYGKVEGRRERARTKPYISSRDATSRLLTVGTCLASPARAVFTGCPGPAWRRRP
eukprot:scaffold118913_cov62-Phaeocystis_antarctica.AAC.1